MQIEGKVALVTGGASGIGAAIARRFAALGAAGVIVADRDVENARKVAQDIGDVAVAIACDVGVEDEIERLVAATRQQFGRIDLYISNAGLPPGNADITADNATWDRMWRVHVMAHVWAARAVIPEMASRGDGYFMITSSAAGLLNIVESAPYASTKHASVGLAEWLRLAHARDGVVVACLCPQAVDTGMTRDVGAGSAGGDATLDVNEVAQTVAQAVSDGRFLVLTHQETAGYVVGKATDYDRWLRGMARLHESYWGTATTR